MLLRVRPYGKTDLGFASVADYSGPVTAQSRAAYIRRSLMSKPIPILAFHHHAATTVAAVLLPDQRPPALHTLASDNATILRFVDRLRRHGPVTCCYEAGPCGFELQRALTTH